MVYPEPSRGECEAHLEDQNEEEKFKRNEENSQENEERLRKFSYLAHLEVRDWLQPWMHAEQSRDRIDVTAYLKWYRLYTSTHTWQHGSHMLIESYSS